MAVFGTYLAQNVTPFSKSSADGNTRFTTNNVHFQCYVHVDFSFPLSSRKRYKGHIIKTLMIFYHYSLQLRANVQYFQTIFRLHKITFGHTMVPLSITKKSFTITKALGTIFQTGESKLIKLFKNVKPFCQLL